ncbi:MAG TPA: hypothetical protein VGK23_12345 [Methanomassiliicoccales archaeon]|jgi:hypothetical protein
MADHSSKDRPDPLPRAVTTLVVLLAFVMSVITLMNYGFYVYIRSAASTFFRALGVGFNTDLILVGLMFFVVLIGVFSEKRLRSTLRSGWTMLIPAILFYSKIDWMYLMGMPGNFSLFSNDLPQIYIFMNGVVLLCASLLFRSHLHLVWVRKALAGRGASEDDLNNAIRGNFFFILILVAMSAGAAALIGASVGLITPVFSIASGATGYAYLLVGLIANAAIVAVFGLYVWNSRRASTVKE